MQVLRLRRVRSWTWSLVLAAVVVAAGCAPPPGGGSGGSPLVGRSFLSTSVTENGQPRALLPGTRMQLSFPSEGRFGASAGCNIFGGSVRVSGDRLDMEVETSTDRACEPPLEDQDGWMVGFLSGDPSYRLDGPNLRLQVGGTVVELVDETVAKPDRSLTGTQWQLESIVGHLVVKPLPPGTAATITFNATTTTASVGFQVKDCNVGSGDVVIGRTTLTIGPLRQTLRACAPGPAEVEAAVTGVLNGTITYDIEGDVLTLTHPSWRGLILRAAPDIPQPPPRPLEGTPWQLARIIDEGREQPLPTGTGATMVISSPTMRVQVQDCNGGSANVVVLPGSPEGGALEIGPFGWTRMACQQGPAEVEAAVLGVLRGVVTYSIAGDTLVLRQSSNRDGLVFRARPPVDRTLVTFHQTGGFIGIDRTLVVHPDGRAVLDGGAERTLTAVQLRELVAVLNAADFATLPPDTIDPEVADAFIYEVTYQGYRVVTSDGRLTPPRLEPVLAELREIVALFG